MQAAMQSGKRMPENPYATPESHVRDDSQRHDFADLSFSQLKKLRNDSHSIRALMVLLFLVGLGVGLTLLLMLVALGQDGFKFSHVGPRVFWLSPVAAFALVGGVGLVQRSLWGRVFAMVLCVCMLWMLPIGTIVGILSLIALSNKKLFGPQQLQHKALEAEFRHRKRNRID